MKFSLYAIFDRVADTPISQPIMAPNDAIAIRGFINSNEAEKKDAEAKGIPVIAVETKELRNLCGIDSETYKVFANTSYVVCNGKNADEVYRDFVSKLEE